MRRSAKVFAVLVASVACATNDGRSSATVRDTMPPASRETTVPAVVTRADTTPTPRVSGGPQRARPEPRASGCGGLFVNAIVKQSALEGTTLARVAEELVGSAPGVIGAPSLSPAIRAFRVQVRDSVRAERVVERLRASSRVESAERDQCRVRVHY